MMNFAAQVKRQNRSGNSIGRNRMMISLYQQVSGKYSVGIQHLLENRSHQEQHARGVLAPLCSTLIKDKIPMESGLRTYQYAIQILLLQSKTIFKVREIRHE